MVSRWPSLSLLVRVTDSVLVLLHGAMKRRMHCCRVEVPAADMLHRGYRIGSQCSWLTC